MIDNRKNITFDNLGQRFYFTKNEDIHQINIFRSLVGAELLVGWAKCVESSQQITTLATIVILEKPILFRNALWKWVPRRAWRKWQQEPYRRRGLGTALLRETIRFARSKGSKQLCGFVIASDYAQNPGLLDWYKSQGFTVVPCTSDNLTGKEADICMDL